MAAALSMTRQGACYFADGRPCTDTLTGSTPGRTCMEAGGLFAPNASCPASLRQQSEFQYIKCLLCFTVSINHEDGTVEEVAPTDPRGARLPPTLEVNAARTGSNNASRRPLDGHRKLSSAHAPYQQQPHVAVAPSADTNDFNCGNNATGTATGQFRVLSNQMIESLDAELSRRHR